MFGAFHLGRQGNDGSVGSGRKKRAVSQHVAIAVTNSTTIANISSEKVALFTSDTTARTNGVTHKVANAAPDRAITEQDRPVRLTFISAITIANSKNGTRNTTSASKGPRNGININSPPTTSPISRGFMARWKIVARVLMMLAINPGTSGQRRKARNTFRRGYFFTSLKSWILCAQTGTHHVSKYL